VFEACVIDFEEYVISSVFLCVWFLEERGEEERGEEKRREEKRRGEERWCTVISMGGRREECLRLLWSSLLLWC